MARDCTRGKGTVMKIRRKNREDRSATIVARRATFREIALIPERTGRGESRGLNRIQGSAITAMKLDILLGSVQVLMQVIQTNNSDVIGTHFIYTN